MQCTISRRKPLCETSGSAMAEGPRDALVSRNSATTKYPYRMAVENTTYGIICVILRLAVFTQYQSVTDTHTETDGQIHDDGMYCISIASHGKNRPYCTRPTKYNYYAGNKCWLIAKCTVIITYLNDNAQTPLNRLAVYVIQPTLQHIQ